MERGITKRAATRMSITALKGAARERTGRAGDLLDDSSEEFRAAAAEKIEGLGRQIRELGRQLDHPDAAHHLARRVERSADYLRFRPSAEMAEDAWDTVRSSPMVWLSAGLLAGLLAYRIASRR